MTQTAQHTPAPWTYAYAPYTTQDGVELPAFEIHGEGEKVCETVEDQPIEAQEANARLIAVYCSREKQYPRMDLSVMVSGNWY